MKEETYSPHSVMCALTEEEEGAFTMKLSLTGSENKNHIILLFKDYKECENLARYILGLAHELCHPKEPINLSDLSNYRVECHSDGSIHYYPKK